MIVNKYLAGLLTVAVLFLTAFQAALQGGIDPIEAWQLAGVAVGAIVTVFVPITPGKWAASLKVGGAVLGAVIAAIIPLALNAWSVETLTIVALAALNALVVQLGINMRVDSARALLADPAVSDNAILQVDPKAVIAAESAPKQQIA